MAIEKAMNQLPSLEVVIGGGGIPKPQADIEIIIEETFIYNTSKVSLL